MEVFGCASAGMAGRSGSRGLEQRFGGNFESLEWSSRLLQEQGWQTGLPAYQRDCRTFKGLLGSRPLGALRTSCSHTQKGVISLCSGPEAAVTKHCKLVASNNRNIVSQLCMPEVQNQGSGGLSSPQVSRGGSFLTSSSF